MKIEKKAKRNMDIERCCNNARLLIEMLGYYQPSSPSQDKELMKVSCIQIRMTLLSLITQLLIYVNMALQMFAGALPVVWENETFII